MTDAATAELDPAADPRALLKTPPNTVVVIFGGNGDLSRRKLLPALWRLHVEGLMPADWRIIGSSRGDFTPDEFDEFARGSIEEFCGTGSTADDPWTVFHERLTYVSGEFTSDTADALATAISAAEDELGGEAARLYYLAVPPGAFGPITEALSACGLTDRARVVYEKPFGVDRQSFLELNELTHRLLRDDQIYTIDHFLAKETLQNVLAMRFANGMFEPVWNRQHIDHVQIDVPEELGVENRAGFYDKVGAMRDMVVSHLFQVLGVIAMEPPYSFGAKPLLDEKVKVFESMDVLEPANVVRGRYAGYDEIDGVPADSDTETFLAAKCYVNNWRWAGVPFYLRTGKRMAESRQSVTLAFREPPRGLFDELPRSGRRDHLTLELGHAEGIRIAFLAKRPGPRMALEPAVMTFSFARPITSESIGPYERLIYDALLGDRTLFTRADGLERTWELVEKVLGDPPPLHAYEPGSWGPAAQDELIAPRRWHLPHRA